MTPTLLLALVLSFATPIPVAAPLRPAAVLARYAAALANVKEPHVLAFDYTLDQTGVRTLAQTHRVFRSGSDERDETLTVDGKTLHPPKVRIFRGRRNRYTISALAPRPADYDFVFVGPRRNAHHYDYVFRLTPKTIRPFSITDVTIDGVRFLPSAISFVTGPNDGSGAVSFGRNAEWWVPYFASARAMVAATMASERLSFYTYRFPVSLPPETFGRARDVGPQVVPTAAPLKADIVAPSLSLPGLPKAGHRPLLPAIAPGAAPSLPLPAQRVTPRPKPAGDAPP